MVTTLPMQTVPSSALEGSRTRNQADIERVRSTQQGSLDAFNMLVLDYQDQVYNQAYWILGDDAAAEDAAQEAFFRAYSKIHTFDGDSFRAWILRITTNYCLDRIRRAKRHPLISLELPGKDDDDWIEDSPWFIDHQASPEQLAEQDDCRTLINQCLMQLKPKDRAPIILVDIQGLDYQEAAAVLGMPLGSLKSRLCRARGKLLQAISQVPGADAILN